MANAIPDDSPRELPNYDKDTKETTQNGSAMAHVDRYGFMGGAQYTDPDEWVTFISFAGYLILQVHDKWNFDLLLVFQ